MMNEKESEQLEELIKEVISGRLDSVHIHNFVQRLITEAVGNAIEEHLDN